jgi:NAD(P)-dependent dehydrogenase (short-subunit alcohol dehydrogenase family)
MKLSGKKVIITGGTQGFGLACAKAFLAEGAEVLVCARNTSSLKDFSSPLLHVVNADVADISSVQDLVKTALDRMGSIDILVSNAGVHGPKGSFEENDLAAWSEAIDINLKGSAFLCHEIIPHFKQKKKGKIILLSGGGATKAMPYFSAYAASKAGLVRFGETLSEELKDFSIDVNMIAPGAMNTRLLDDVLSAGPEKVGEKYYQQVLKQQASGGTSPEQGAALCVFLASDESNGVTGKLISAVWDPWKDLPQHKEDLQNSDIYTLRRIIPAERGKTWGDV